MKIIKVKKIKEIKSQYKGKEGKVTKEFDNKYYADFGEGFDAVIIKEDVESVRYENGNIGRIKKLFLG